MIKRPEYPQAVYTPQRVREYIGNPFIEALPEIMSTDVLAQRLTRHPPFDPLERDEPSHLRFHMLERLRQLLIVFPAYFDIESSIGALIRQGYIHRNPFDPAAVRRVYQARTAEMSPLVSAVGPRASSELVFVGLSGLGKTTLIESILDCYSPQILRHSSYNGQPLHVTQIVWVKINCPHDGSLSAVCRSFFAEIDAITGTTRYAQEYADPRLSVTNLTDGMQQVAASYALGSLVVDEMQNLSLQKSGGREKMMNFFMNLRASIGVPVTYVGTYKSIALFQSEMRYCRRASGRGFKELRRPPSWKSPVWSLLLEAVFAYQWVKRPIALSDGLKKLLWDLSQGITDVLVALVINAQDYAIRHKIETLDTKIFNHVYKTDLRLLHPALNALRSRNPKKLARFDDLYAQAKGEMVPLNYEALGLDPATILGSVALTSGAIENSGLGTALPIRPSRSRATGTEADGNYDLDLQEITEGGGASTISQEEFR